MDNYRWRRHVRSYVLLPGARFVKDLRNGYETADVAAVLDGDIQPFLDAALPYWTPRFLAPGTAVPE